MSAEEVTVSLSRLALAKAIKTPDAGEDEAEPWSKSIIFHQAHIDSNMRNSIVSPQQNRRRPGQRQQPLLHKNQKQQRGNYPPSMHHNRPDELHQQRQSRHNNLQQYPNQRQQQQQQQQQHIAQVNPKTNGNKGYANITVSKTAGAKSGRHIIPSDDEDDEEDNEEEEEEEDDDDDDDGDDDDEKEEEAPTVIKNTKNIPQNNTLVQAREMAEADSKHQVNVTQQTKAKGKNHRQQPSDDEDEEDDEEEDESDRESENEENNKDSDKDSLDNGHEATNALAAEENQKTYARRMSTLRQLEKGSDNPRRRSRSLSDMQFTLPLAQIGEHDLSLNDEWQKTMADVENITGSSMSDLGSSAMTSNEGDIIEEPVVSMPQKANYRMSTLGEMDFYQYQQQQQQIAFHNMQMQQAMQMAQMQQYQQAIQMQQQMMLNYDPRTANNRQSAMDVMLQMEQDKSASRKNKKKPINTSNVNLNDGLLGRVPEQRQHNFSFQGQMMSNGKRMTRKSDHNLRESRNRSSHRPPSTMYYDGGRAGSSMGMDPRMYSQMGRSESPMPTVSMSTPMQYLSPNRPRTRQSQQPPMMTQSRSTGRSSYMPSERQSTNWGTKSKERVR